MNKLKTFLKQKIINDKQSLTNIYIYIYILDFFVSFFLGIVITISTDYLDNGLRIDFSGWLLAKGIISGLIFFIVSVLFRNQLEKITNIDSESQKLYSAKKTSLIILTVIIFLAWLPILIGMFPGTVINDTWKQLDQFDSGIFSDHHPIFDTLIMGSIIFLSVKLTPDTNWQFAFFVYVLIQAIFTAFSFAYTIYYSKNKLKLNNKILTIALVFYCILPIFPLAVQTISKDAIFSWIYVLFIINYIEIVRTKGKFLNGVKGFTSTFVLSVLCLLTKKVGGYVVIGSFIILLIFEFKNLKKLSFIIVYLILFMAIIEPAIFKSLKIEPGGKQEKYPMLFQQTANYVKTYPNDCTDEEKEIIDNVLAYDDLAGCYNPVNADCVKGYSQMGKDEDYGKYVIVWLKQGIRHPDAYIKAALSMLSGSFSTTEYKPLTNMRLHDQLNTLLINEKYTIRYGVFNISSQVIDKIYRKLKIGKIFSFGFWATLMPTFIFITLLKYRKNENKIKGIIVSAPLILSVILGLWLAPVSASYNESMRYVYPIIYTVPLTVLWCCYCIKENKNKKENENE